MFTHHEVRHHKELQRSSDNVTESFPPEVALFFDSASRDRVDGCSEDDKPSEVTRGGRSARALHSRLKNAPNVYFLFWGN